MKRFNREILDDTPPHDPDCERALLGSILILPTVFDDVINLVRPADFHEAQNVAVYTVMTRMYHANKKIDMKLFLAQVRKDGAMDACGGAAYIGELTQSSPIAANAVYYAREIQQMALKRTLIHTGIELIQAGYKETSLPEELLSECEEKVFAVRSRYSETTSVTSKIGDILQEAMIAIDSRRDKKVAFGLESGYPDFDETVAIANGELIVLAARPSMGKSALALNMATNIAMNGNAVLFFSLEMSAMALGERMLSSIGQVDSYRMRTGTHSNDDRRKLVEANAAISHLPLDVDSSPRMTLSEIAAKSRQYKRKHGLAFVVIDYLQMISPENYRDPREQQVALISRRLKGLARELDIPVMCLAQLNRQLEAGTDKRPKLSHLRESGSIEQDADVVLFVHRDEYYAKSDQERAAMQGKAEIIVSKNRSGRTGTVPLTWHGPTVTFRSYSEQSLFDSEPYYGRD